MTSTGSEREDVAVPRRAIGYTQEGGEPWHPTTPIFHIEVRLQVAGTPPPVISCALQMHSNITSF